MSRTQVGAFCVPFIVLIIVKPVPALIRGRKKLPSELHGIPRIKQTADLQKIKFDLPRLTPDTEEDCPFKSHEIIDYMKIESADLDDFSTQRMKFLRTATWNDVKYWILSYTELDGTKCYITVGQTYLCPGLGYSSAGDLSPVQYIIADYLNLPR